MNEEDALYMWVVYANPSDYPGKHVVRTFRIIAGEEQRAKEPHFVGDSLDEARKSVPPGLVCITRALNDDPVIVEVWM